MQHECLCQIIHIWFYNSPAFQDEDLLTASFMKKILIFSNQEIKNNLSFAEIIYWGYPYPEPYGKQE